MFPTQLVPQRTDYLVEELGDSFAALVEWICASAQANLEEEEIDLDFVEGKA